MRVKIQKIILTAMDKQQLIKLSGYIFFLVWNSLILREIVSRDVIR